MAYQAKTDLLSFFLSALIRIRTTSNFRRRIAPLEQSTKAEKRVSGIPLAGSRKQPRGITLWLLWCSIEGVKETQETEAEPSRF